MIQPGETHVGPKPRVKLLICSGVNDSGNVVLQSTSRLAAG